MLLRYTCIITKYIKHTHTTASIMCWLSSSILTVQLYFPVLFFFCFLGLHPQHMEVSRLQVKSELQLLATATATQDPSHICDLRRSSDNTVSLTQWMRPGIEPASSWILVGLISVVPREELHYSTVLNITFISHQCCQGRRWYFLVMDQRVK